MVETHLKDGAQRIKSNFMPCVKKGNLWIDNPPISKKTLQILEQYDEQELLNELLDNKDSTFLKGFLDDKGNPSGPRVTCLPSGQKLARGGFNLFAKNLTFNSDKRKLWDVCYTNASGSKTYLYSEDKVHLEQKQKSKKVDLFAKHYEEIISKLGKDLSKGIKYLALYVLLLTHIRVGNLEYYNHLKHKGLTTLQKRDITIKNNTLEINFIGKDAIPQRVIKNHSLETRETKNLERQDKIWQKVLTLLRKRLGELNPTDFVFAKDNIPLHSHDFTSILHKYTGEHFYPHIIRSFYADSKCKEFLKHHRKPTKNQVMDQFKEIAQELGHKKYSKKKEKYIIDTKVTLTNYIRSEYSEKMKERIQNKQ